jgi:hypothetical protein
MILAYAGLGCGLVGDLWGMCQEAAIDHNSLRRDEAGFIRTQEQGRRGHIIFPAHAPHQLGLNEGAPNFI